MWTRRERACLRVRPRTHASACTCLHAVLRGAQIKVEDQNDGTYHIIMHFQVTCLCKMFLNLDKNLPTNVAEARSSAARKPSALTA